MNRTAFFRPTWMGPGIALPALIALGVAGYAFAPQALILDGGDETGNSTPPDDDPGWRNVGHHTGTPTVVYLGDRWVLSAEHSGLNSVTFEGKRYEPLPDSALQLEKPESKFSDLLLFRIDEDPGLPALSIATSPPVVGQNVILIAAGASRGGRFTIYDEDLGAVDGFTWEMDQTKRWGTNRVETPPQLLSYKDTDTMAFPLAFDRIEDLRSTRNEAAGALGDSGGALFDHRASGDSTSEWVLSGIIFSVTNRGESLPRMTFYNDLTWVADLSENFGSVGMEYHPHDGQIYACTNPEVSGYTTAPLFRVELDGTTTLVAETGLPGNCDNLGAPWGEPELPPID